MCAGKGCVGQCGKVCGRQVCKRWCVCACVACVCVCGEGREGVVVVGCGGVCVCAGEGGVAKGEVKGVRVRKDVHPPLCPF